MRRTKIVVTVGPSIETEEILEKLINIGVNVFRFNFSHGDHSYHLKLYEKIRKISQDKGKFVATLMDLSGPKIRIGQLKSPINVNQGDVVKIKYGNFTGEGKLIPLSYKEIIDALKIDDIIYIADGIVKLKIIKKKEDEIDAEVLSPGIISSKKGLNLPGVTLKIPALTEKDKNDLKFGLDIGFDIIALSFVKNRDDIIMAKEIIKKYKKDTPVIAKIERNEAIENIDEILDIADGLMVARGDLGIEIDVEKVPVVQKMLIKKGNSAGKPVITATQMLTSMIKNPRPTRAEVSDIANAVLDGTDAVMLSDETTIGDYPVEAVKVMIKTIEEAERVFKFYRFSETYKNLSISDAIAETASFLSKELNADGIAVFTKSGLSARRVSKTRPKCKILAISPDINVLRRLNLVWGVVPYYKSIDTTNADELLIEFLKKSEKDYGRENIFIATIGYPAGIPNSTNIIRAIRKQDYDFYLKNYSKM